MEDERRGEETRDVPRVAVKRRDRRVVSREGGILLHRELPGSAVLLVRHDDIGLELR